MVEHRERLEATQLKAEEKAAIEGKLQKTNAVKVQIEKNDGKRNRKNSGTCDLCEKNFKTSEELVEHKKNYPRADVEKALSVYKEKDTIYKCLQCSGEFRLKEDFDYHQELHKRLGELKSASSNKSEANKDDESDIDSSFEIIEN
ncbi:C2H2-type domain-containing protein [Caenorhabditis elegans]|uniref:C2H2-type domain-containing protein n=1 Tax=Caenorhabditis elegans TaxID=6239 RepID=Q21825_CAEEL|nr:C2H2-type domain-containing protein [Caenorhabditis elegans]CAA83620.2 C2H2-type domain-containing protein [Caenorhabditis elegans]|eukprot:NP_497887.2 Uncharacterized protein CELE_R07E5.5 [Caenorhabditis elegans]